MNSIYTSARRAWPELEKAWDSTIYQNLRLIVADENNAWAIDRHNITKIPYSEVRKRKLPITYMYFQEIHWPDGRPTIYVGLGPTLPVEEKERFESEIDAIPLIFNIATHEAFHFFVQDESWKIIENNARATAYPVQSTPRLYRNSIIRALYATLQGDPNGLGHARYWFNQWKKNYPEEALGIKNNDILEGTAQYIDISSELIAKGKGIGTEEFRYALMEKLMMDIDFIHTNSDSESYTIGSLSGFIMNMQKIEWQKDVKKGITPVEILLRNAPVIQQQIDRDLEKKIDKEVKKTNSKTGHKIKLFEDNYSNPKSIRFFISSELLGFSTFSDGGSFRTTKTPHEILVGLSFESKWSGGSFNLKESVAASIEKSETYKNKTGVLILYSDTLPQKLNGRLQLKNNDFEIDIPYPDNIGRDNIIYLP